MSKGSKFPKLKVSRLQYVQSTFKVRSKYVQNTFKGTSHLTRSTCSCMSKYVSPREEETKMSLSLRFNCLASVIICVLATVKFSAVVETSLRSLLLDGCDCSFVFLTANSSCSRWQVLWTGHVYGLGILDGFGQRTRDELWLSLAETDGNWMGQVGVLDRNCWVWCETQTTSLASCSVI